MTEIGVRELKVHASEIVRALRDRRARYLVTYRGRPVGVLLPLDAVGAQDCYTDAQSASSAWDELTLLGQQVAEGSKASKAAADLLSDMRR